jgi:hypothetical protein
MNPTSESVASHDRTPRPLNITRLRKLPDVHTPATVAPSSTARVYVRQFRRTERKYIQ